MTLTNKQVQDINRALGYIEGFLDADNTSREEIMEAIRAIYSVLDKAEEET